MAVLRNSCWLLFVLLSAASLSRISSASEQLADAQKLQTIYRMYEDYKKKFPTVEDIAPKKAMALMESAKVVFVDIRDPKEQKVSMLPGALTQEEFKKNLEKYRDYVIIGYCTISYRSGKLAESLRKKGVNMLNLKGGLLAWVHEGGKIFDASGETRRVHVYSKKWNYLPGGYEAVW
jgi:rhodanese-related sulfurtransferase